MSELLPCPHCGKTETLEVVAAVDLLCDEDERDAYCHSDSFGVVCSAAKPDGPGGCGAMGGFMPTKEGATEAWNRRTQSAESQPANYTEGGNEAARKLRDLGYEWDGQKWVLLTRPDKAQQWYEALEFAARHLSSDWPEDCQQIVRKARKALRDHSAF